LTGPDTPEMRQKFINTIPLGRLTTLDDVAAAVVYLASEDASFITGVALELDVARCV
jgi:3-oxoacyl-[acyl-carrier protein] reductase